MESIIVYRVIITLLIMALGVAITVCNFYRVKRIEYKDRLLELTEKTIVNNSHRKEKSEELVQEILMLKSLIKKLIIIIKSKPAILAKEKLRFTFSVRANGKRVARIKAIGDTTKPISVMGESMVEISTGKYVHLDKLIAVLTRSGTYPYKIMEESIDKIRQYNI